MNLVDKYKLTRKIAKLEKLYIENTSDADSTTSGSTRTTRAGKITANIFSKKLANVKAAVESGQDVNQTNDKGFTPLALACKSKVIMSDIVEYLLDHGANANDVVDNRRKPVLFAVLDKGDLKSVVSLVKHGANLNIHYNSIPVVEYALKYCEIKDVDVLILLVSDHLSFFDRLRALRYLTGNRSTLSGNADNLISKLVDVDVNDRFECVNFFYHNSPVVMDDLRTGNGAIFDKFVSYGYLPFIGTKHIDSLSKSALNKVYNALKLACDCKLDYSYANSLSLLFEMCDKVCSALNVPSITYDLINADFINKLNHSAISSAIWILLGNKKLEKIKELAKSNLRVNEYAAHETIRGLIYFIKNASVDRDLTIAACRLLNKFMGSRPIKLMSLLIKDIQEIKNRVFLDYLFERGMGDILTEDKYSDRPSKEFIDACEEYGFEIKYGSNKQNKDDSRAYIADIVRAIDDDTWNRRLDAIVTEDPRVLLSDEVQAALNDARNSGSVTRRQLLRKIEQLPAEEADVYDM